LELTPSTPLAVPATLGTSLQDEIFGAIPSSQPAIVTVSTSTAIAKSQDDPFGGAFGAYPAVPVPSMTTLPPPAASGVDQFDPFDLARPSALPPVPPVDPSDDFDSLFAATPTKTEVTVSTFDFHGSNSQGNELENFFANLDVSHQQH
jgi:hypothetical protein